MCHLISFRAAACGKKRWDLHVPQGMMNIQKSFEDEWSFKMDAMLHVPKVAGI